MQKILVTMLGGGVVEFAETGDRRVRDSRERTLRREEKDIYHHLRVILSKKAKYRGVWGISCARIKEWARTWAYQSSAFQVSKSRQ